MTDNRAIFVSSNESHCSGYRPQSPHLTNGAMRILITATFAAMLATAAQARTPDKVSPDDISAARIQNETLWQWPDPTPEAAATRPWLMQVTFLYTDEKPLLGGGDRFASREDCEVARRRLGPRFSEALKECPTSQLA